MKDLFCREGPDDSARRRIRESLDESLVVEAAAGTGKTTELVYRLVELLRSGRTTPSRIVAVTFTRKAAGELKLRLRGRLDQVRRQCTDPAEMARLDDAVAHLEEAHVGTIHSFCGELLRERPVEAGIDPAFEELAEDEAPAFFDQAFRPWIQERLLALPPSLRRLLSRLPSGDPGEGSPLDAIRGAAWRFLEWRDFQAPWTRRPFDRRQRIGRCVERIGELAEILEKAQPRDDLAAALRPVLDLALWIRRAEREGSLDEDRLEAFLVELPRKLARSGQVRRGPSLFAPGFPRQQVLEMKDHLQEELLQFRLEADADLAAVIQHEFRDLVGRYEQLKLRHGRLDFVDLLIRARDLLVHNASVRRYFQSHFTHIFVDEFQDTDPLQAEILLLLAADDPGVSDWKEVRPVPGKLFLVGDPKQSIYRFRRADVLLYQQVRDRLAARGVGLVHLTRSFRSVRPIQEAVNAAFAPAMVEDPASGQPAYLPLDEVRPPAPGQPSLVALPVPYPYGRREIANFAIEESLPATAAAFAHWLIHESGWKVADPEADGGWVPVAPRHIAFLFRRFVSWNRDITREYARELEVRGIPHVLAGSRSFHEREEIEALATALSAIEWPDDELSVYATLRGPFFSISDRKLFLFREEHGPIRPFRRYGDVDPALQMIPEALHLLERFHRLRNHRPIARTITDLLHTTRAHAALALRPAGHQVLANVQRLCELARAFEAGGGLSFRAFVDLLQADSGIRRAETTVLEEGADGVRLMTVHGAKGLEFPVVFLVDLTCKAAAAQPDKYVDVDAGLAAFSVLGCRPWELIEHQEEELKRDQAEGLRLAYVAATRARDLLVVPVVGDAERDGWLAVLNKALYPPADRKRQAQPAPGCPPFGSASVLGRPPAFDGSTEASVRPGLHRPQVGEHPVVWFDPALLNLQVPPDFGLRQKELLAEDETAEQVQRDNWQRWLVEREACRQTGVRPSLEIRRVTRELLQQPPPDPVPVRIETVPRDATRPAGRGFGTLVHTILRDVPFGADLDQIRRLAELASRSGAGADSNEIDAAVEAVAATLQHPLLRRAAASPEALREAPLLLRLEDGPPAEGTQCLVDGTVDLVFREDERWILVDFKTDDPTGAAGAHYVRQVQWYAHALNRLTQTPVEPWLLGI